MNDRIHELYCFLKENRKYNKDLQEKFYISIINTSNKIEDNVICLLYHIANTQSQPKIDKLSEFYKLVCNNINKLISLRTFTLLLNGKESTLYKDLFIGLTDQSGWGDKTAALFAKTIFHLHNGQYRNELKIWHDAPKEIIDGDKLYLPVDSVIINVFKSLGMEKCNFRLINDKLHKIFKGNEIEVWDDLWFWGFITQYGSGEKRSYRWNPNKYWALEHTNKNASVINEIKNKAEYFLNLINHRNA